MTAGCKTAGRVPAGCLGLGRIVDGRVADGWAPHPRVNDRQDFAKLSAGVPRLLFHDGDAPQTTRVTCHPDPSPPTPE